MLDTPASLVRVGKAYSPCMFPFGFGLAPLLTLALASAAGSEALDYTAAKLVKKLVQSRGEPVASVAIDDPAAGIGWWDDTVRFAAFGRMAGKRFCMTV